MTLAGWLVPGAAVLVLFASLAFVAYRNTRRSIDRTRARRPDLSQAEFVALLGRDVRPETAKFLWEQMAFLLPTIAPHPDDHLWNDLPIDHEEPTSDWLIDFAKRHGAPWEDWPDWPVGLPCTVRNYARWLERGLDQARA